jgi:hypothetical protein
VEDPAPAQVYEYDADSGTLVRVSIGEEGFDGDGNDGVLGSENPAITDEWAGDARAVAPRNTVEVSVPVNTHPSMSENGAFVFFQSPVALVPGALNDVSIAQPEGEERFAQNIYEYHDGHVYLISDGKDTTSESDVSLSPVHLVGSDASGANVFFWTFDSLVPEDTDTLRDLYDAHVCSGGEPCHVPAPEGSCGEGSCQGASSSLGVSVAPAGSATFFGPGDLAPVPAPVVKPTPVLSRAQKLARALKACRKDKSKKRRGVCEAQARKRYGTKKAAVRGKR